MQRKNGSRHWTAGVAFSALAAAWTANAGAAPVNVALVSSADTVIRQDQTGDNFGAYTRIWVGHNSNPSNALRRGLIKFDLSTIPEGATITAASLQMRAMDSHQVASNFGLYRTLVNWNEGTKTGKGGGAASAGEATWTNRVTGTSAWGAAGGQAGVDYKSAASASLSIANVGLYTWVSNPAVVADVQFWSNNRTQNFGWFVISSGETVTQSVTRFATREDATAANRPQLLVTYEVPEPSALLLAGVGAGALYLRSRRRLSA